MRPGGDWFLFWIMAVLLSVLCWVLISKAALALFEWAAIE